MKDRRKLVFIGVFSLILFIVYKNWLVSPEIIGGDWPYFFPDVLKNLSFLPSSWVSWQGNGLGGINPVYFLHLYQNSTVSIAYYLGIPWPIIYKIFWFGAFILISAFSSIYLIKKVISDLSFDKALIAGLIFTTNTYILMVVGGGQMGVALAYAIVPFVLARFLILLNSSDFHYKNTIIAGLALSTQVLFDPRISYITAIGIGIYILMNFGFLNKNKIFLLFTSFVIVFLLHLFWILPLLIFHGNANQIFDAFNISFEAVKFFSFASFSQAFSLLHPNWPENVFGKVYFMRPEFLLIPILAFSSLLFLSSKRKTQSAKLQLKTQNLNNNLAMKQSNNTTILFFGLLGILGAFLAKGANEPFGQIYLWMFNYVPGFSMFRDPTKWYTLVAISYSILIPFSIGKIYEYFKSKFKIQKYIPNLFLILTILYLMLLIKPALLGQLTGTFKRNEVPKDYVMLKDFLRQQPDFFRTLWVPRQQRFAFSTIDHPAVEASPMFNATNSTKLAGSFRQRNTQDYLSKLGIKYVVIPYDSLGEIFLEDRKYDSKKRRELEKELDEIYWLTKIQNGKIAVYENQSFKDHFWLENNDKLTYKMISPVKYSLHLNINKPTNLIFSENYNSYWQTKIGDEKINSNKSSDNLNMFKLTKIGSYNVEVYFNQDIFYKYGIVISLVFLTVTLFMLKLKNYEK